ncbi:MAG: Na+/H+ antiporter NhaC family protein [Eubacteriales bacterium]|nr:Na+/H+ antiporter NhaC family protein [Eubacteriales bacterium]
MDLLAAFFLFILCMALCLSADLTMILPLAAGFVLFSAVAVRRGFLLKSVLRFAAGSFKESFIVIRILLLIGCLTGMWRLSGTVAYFVSFGVSVIPARLFLLAAFLLAAVMSFALGTSFGVTATAGVILISIARAGGVDPVLASGAILSGVYVGDRGSPAASSGNLVAVLTHTDMRKNVRAMLKTSFVPFLVCCVIYYFLSVRAPMSTIDASVLEQLEEEFSLKWYCILPAVLMIILPFAGLSIKLSMAVSLAVSAVVAVAVQKCGITECLTAMILGFEPRNAELAGMLSGGGVFSMLEVCVILLISCSYGNIFRETGLLSGVNTKLRMLADRIGRFPVMLLLGFGVSALFCNQTIGAIMQSNLSEELYGESEEEKSRKMIDMENSVILIAGLVPWCIASSVPLSMLGANPGAIPFAFYLWLLPLWWLAVSKFRNGGKFNC